MASSGTSIPENPVDSDQYNQAKNLAFSLEMEELQGLRDEVHGEINRRAIEIVDRQREEDEKKKTEEEETESLYVAWLPKHFERSDRKMEERSERNQKGPRYGYGYHLEEINTSDEGSDAVEDRRRMERYEEWRLRRRFEFERANPKIFARTMQEGEPKVERQPLVRIEPRDAHVDDSSATDDDLLDVSRESEEDESNDEDESSSGESDTSHASSGSSCSERYEEDEDWSYDDEDY
ncbi:uncharacterized protein LOC113315661 [Papaver somniferum]|uniref:uncharacterized protein LOC113315661 n=1 Tax=Papaver somniferum TaxID=3469 RepID=UPI000E6FA037|nr:uncharacterized protein LOC113315661 [Papaver somniferum]